MHLQEGHLSVMWKDTIFNYSYFLWFEDSSVCVLSKDVSIIGVCNIVSRLSFSCLVT